MTHILASEYNKKKAEIKKRLREFRSVWKQSDKRVFSELSFCVCTPQSKAVYCDKAVSVLRKSGVLFRGNLKQLKAGLKGVRFPNNKARYILKSRKLFTTGRAIRIKNRIDTEDIPRTRRWLARNVTGIGFKEASHFLRNIGFGDDLAILDVHVLRNMVKYGIIKSIPKNISEAGYLTLEEKLRRFSGKVNIPLGELDLLFWSNETGEIFK